MSNRTFYSFETFKWAVYSKYVYVIILAIPACCECELSSAVVRQRKFSTLSALTCGLSLIKLGVLQIITN